MNYFHVIILAVIEGITEFLPISSTGHLILATKILNIPSTEFLKSFGIFIQLGAILSVIFLYWDKLFRSKKVWMNVFVAFIPSGIFGLLFYKLIKQYLLSNDAVTIVSLFLGGLFFIFLEKRYTEQKHRTQTIESMNLKQSFGIGLFQAVSMIPGVSRAGATILGGLLLGIKRTASVEFSFLLAIPTMLAATALDFVKSEFRFSLEEQKLLAVGFIISFLVALAAVKWFVRFVENNTFVGFGVYRIILAVVYGLFFLK